MKEHYKCTVVCFEHEDWSLEPSNAIKNRNPDVEFISIDRHKSLLQTLFAKVCHKVAIILNPFFKSNIKIAAFASNDKTPQLRLALKYSIKTEELHTVIAHNLGAFYPAMVLAKKSNAKLQLDIEDYHPGEELYFNKKYELQNRLLIMQETFNRAHTISYASEGIKLKSESVFKLKSHTKRAVIINAFRATDFSKPIEKNTSLNFVWFSQNISHKRGLEEVFRLAKEYKHINVHLIGKANEGFIEAMQPSENVIIHKPMHQDKLHRFLSTMDIGLALENKDGDGNRNICLTNKFLAYAQAGLYIFATDTFGQKHFLEQIGNQFGVIIETSLKATLMQFDEQVLDHKNKIDRWEVAKNFSWEKQSERLLVAMK
ncbi:glycosyltransferase family 4 protein [Subsaximicrobium wynnwilliamsii]|uniref:Glycosyltransferase family 4 protein n=1 Tax=Subsaximicrobium wynnwilliamsii TaxID=291179 RepID=A0A5C6ZH85_9FLAO|nr:glycosyltransferase family 4 protein [Subsaximicrobium wynnwilliamsii]TXD81367.1 glycosyltransferase family 4 protein [Subsaximicrobium wynnwilliamsii]TXD89063.1 glycosyltransferase family 4 protein [Subsaximicrobium wynnwilliamsii]TXE00741.1 glycosyltransferase family 4 protein [Subsaximicrobium wynnwilliamsii]